MIGFNARDIIRFVSEGTSIKIKDSPLFSSCYCFTDGSGLTLAVAKAVLEELNYKLSIRETGRHYLAVRCGRSLNHRLSSEFPESFLRRSMTDGLLVIGGEFCKKYHRRGTFDRALPDMVLKGEKR